MRIAVYPGTFNPITNGHTDLVERAAGLFDKIVVAVGTNTQKGKGLPASERVALAKEVLREIDNVEVVSFGVFLASNICLLVFWHLLVCFDIQNMFFDMF